MIVHLLDVDHGEAAIIESQNGKIVMIGAGKNSEADYGPTDWLRERSLRADMLILNHLDEDHLNDLPDLDDDLRPPFLTQHSTLRPDHVIGAKRQIGQAPGIGLLAADQLVRNYTFPVPNTGIDLEIVHFEHPTTSFDDTNNLSVVTFVRDHGVTMMFPGDMEEAGWQELLEDPEFCRWLGTTNIFVASHHGRMNGYCSEVFGFCQPVVILISDKPVAHVTQEHDCYCDHASGVNRLGGFGNRKTLTTRDDGKMTIQTFYNQEGSSVFTIDTANARYGKVL